jgi:segregation and condensation protein B
MMDENKEVPSQENPTASERPAMTEEETDTLGNVTPEATPQEAEPVDLVEPTPRIETPVDSVSAGEEQTPAPELSKTPTAMEEPVQPGEALVEMLDAAQPQEAEQKSAEGEQPANAAETSGSPSCDLCPPSSDGSPTLESVIEAVLFATDEPLPESKLAGIVETTAKQVRECVDSLNAKYEAHHNAFRIEQIAGGYQMLTQPIYNSWLKKMVKARSDNKLSPAAMETLAIIAYKQPVIRADIEAVRGVAVGEVIRSLMYKGLVKIAGRAEILGRPMLYGTTKKFLEIFGLNSVKDLPKAEDLKNPDRG